MEILALIKRINNTNTFDFFKLSTCSIDMVAYIKSFDCTRCDICGRNTMRNNVYLVNDNSKILQVGQDCLSNLTNPEMLEVINKSTSQNDLLFNEFLCRQGMYNHFDGKKVLENLFSLYSTRGFIKFNSYEHFQGELYKYEKDIKPFKVETAISMLIDYLKNTNNEFLYKLYQYLTTINRLGKDSFRVLQYAFNIYNKMVESNQKSEQSQAKYCQELYKGEVFEVKSMELKSNKVITVAYKTNAETYNYIVITDTNKVLDISGTIALEPTDYIGKKCICKNKVYVSKWVEGDDKNLKSYNSRNYGIVTLCNRLKLV